MDLTTDTPNTCTTRSSQSLTKLLFLHHHPPLCPPSIRLSFDPHSAMIYLYVHQQRVSNVQNSFVRTIPTGSDTPLSAAAVLLVGNLVERKIMQMNEWKLLPACLTVCLSVYQSIHPSIYSCVPNQVPTNPQTRQSSSISQQLSSPTVQTTNRPVKRPACTIPYFFTHP